MPMPPAADCGMHASVAGIHKDECFQRGRPGGLEHQAARPCSGQPVSAIVLVVAVTSRPRERMPAAEDSDPCMVQ